MITPNIYRFAFSIYLHFNFIYQSSIPSRPTFSTVPLPVRPCSIFLFQSFLQPTHQIIRVIYIIIGPKSSQYVIVGPQSVFKYPFVSPRLAIYSSSTFLPSRQSGIDVTPDHIYRFSCSALHLPLSPKTKDDQLIRHPNIYTLGQYETRNEILVLPDSNLYQHLIRFQRNIPFQYHGKFGSRLPAGIM